MPGVAGAVDFLPEIEIISCPLTKCGIDQEKLLMALKAYITTRFRGLNYNPYFVKVSGLKEPAIHVSRNTGV